MESTVTITTKGFFCGLSKIVRLSENGVPLIPMGYSHVPHHTGHLEDIPLFQTNPYSVMIN